MIAHPNPVHITPVEREVWQLAALGLPNKQIADTLGKSIKTVQSQRTNLQAKLKTNCPAGLTRAAVEFGVIAIEVRPLVLVAGNGRWVERWVLP